MIEFAFTIFLLAVSFAAMCCGICFILIGIYYAKGICDELRK